MKDIVHGIEVDYSRDGLFDELGIKRLQESYMKEEKSHHKKDLRMYQRRLGLIQNIRKDCMNIAVDIGCHILLLFSALGVVSVAFLYHVSYLIYMIVLKAWLIVWRK